MIGVAASVHLAAVLPNMPYIEYRIEISYSPLITDLLVPDLKPDAHGWIEVPKGPGLGFTLSEDLVKRYRVEPS
jgi:L-alanine-DL-glutamate epimerase-like enolase superfamily enzyme